MFVVLECSYSVLPDMSPERRGKSRYSLPGRIRPLDERSSAAITPEQRINMFALPSLEQVVGTFELRMSNEHPLQYKLFLRHREKLKEFYEARVKYVATKDMKPIQKFSSKYYTTERLRKLIGEMLKPHTDLIRDLISLPPLKK